LLTPFSLGQPSAVPHDVATVSVGLANWQKPNSGQYSRGHRHVVVDQAAIDEPVDEPSRPAPWSPTTPSRAGVGGPVLVAAAVRVSVIIDDRFAV